MPARRISPEWAAAAAAWRRCGSLPSAGTGGGGWRDVAAGNCLQQLLSRRRCPQLPPRPPASIYSICRHVEGNSASRCLHATWVQVYIHQNHHIPTRIGSQRQEWEWEWEGEWASGSPSCRSWSMPTTRVGFRALCLRFRARPARNCPKLPETAQN